LTLYSKFFGSQNGTKAPAQQAKLSFGKKPDVKKETVSSRETKESAPKAEDKQKGVKREVKEEDTRENDAEAPKSSASPKVKEEDGGNADTPKKRPMPDDMSESEGEPPTKRQRQKAETKERNDSPKPSKITSKSKTNDVKDDEKLRSPAKHKSSNVIAKREDEEDVEEDDKETSSSDSDVNEDDEVDGSGDEEPEVEAKVREKIQSTMKSNTKDPYPDWKEGSAVPYAALCTTFSLIEMTTKRLEISAHCSLFLRQVMRLSPQDLKPTLLLMLGKLAADYAGVELGIGESLVMKAIAETTGRSLTVIKADQKEIGDLGLVAAKSRSNQPTMFKPKPLTVSGVHAGLMEIATLEGSGAQSRKIGGIKKLLSAADLDLAAKGKGGVDITKDKGGPSESKYIVRTLEGKMRLGLADKTVLVALAHAMVWHDVAKDGKKVPSHDMILQGEQIVKNVYK